MSGVDLMNSRSEVLVPLIRETKRERAVCPEAISLNELTDEVHGTDFGLSGSPRRLNSFREVLRAALTGQVHCEAQGAAVRFGDHRADEEDGRGESAARAQVGEARAHFGEWSKHSKVVCLLVLIALLLW